MLDGVLNTPLSNKDNCKHSFTSQQGKVNILTCSQLKKEKNIFAMMKLHYRIPEIRVGQT